MSVIDTVHYMDVPCLRHSDDEGEISTLSWNLGLPNKTCLSTLSIKKCNLLYTHRCLI